MRRKMIFLSSLVLIAFNLRAQQTALFQATLYFEDAIGNKDSVIVGYDPNATYGIDPEFGESEITVPDAYTPCYWITVDTEEPDHLVPLTIFPNPSSGVIKTRGEIFETLSVWDSTGCHIADFSTAQNNEIDLSGLPAGI